MLDMRLPRNSGTQFVRRKTAPSPDLQCGSIRRIPREESSRPKGFLNLPRSANFPHMVSR